MDNKNKIQELSNKIQQLYNEKKEIDNKVYLLNNKIAEIKYGFKDGEEVLYNNKRAVIVLKGCIYTLSVRLYTKDGSLSANTRYVYNTDNLDRINKEIN